MKKITDAIEPKKEVKDERKIKVDQKAAKRIITNSLNESKEEMNIWKEENSEKQKYHKGSLAPKKGHLNWKDNLIDLK